MSEVDRLLTLVDLDDRRADGTAAWAHLYAILVSSERSLLLDDRGWVSSAPIAAQGQEDVECTAKMVVGPEGPISGETDEQMEAAYWSFLERKLRDAGVQTTAQELQGLRHEVEIGERLRRCLAQNP
jgi:hypothetical protein